MTGSMDDADIRGRPERAAGRSPDDAPQPPGNAPQPPGNASGPGNAPQPALPARQPLVPAPVRPARLEPAPPRPAFPPSAEQRLRERAEDARLKPPGPEPEPFRRARPAQTAHREPELRPSAATPADAAEPTTAADDAAQAAEAAQAADPATVAADPAAPAADPAPAAAGAPVPLPAPPARGGRDMMPDGPHRGGWPAPTPRIGELQPPAAVAGNRESRRRPGVPSRPARPVRPPGPPRRPAAGLTGLLVLGLIAAFFAWVSAEPFWLAVGHSHPGTATVYRCGGGIDRGCLVRFDSADGRFTVHRAVLAGAADSVRRVGARTQARMVSAHGRLAYAGSPAGLHLRWILGLFLVLACGLLIAWSTGTWRLPKRRARLVVFAMSMGGPLLLAGGMAVAAW